ncbi:MAG: type II toxin-antitoxin system HicA family toxin [Gemmatimonadota bacterium]|nr:type II toxin-antitoxin system HicA family toxin [Gemmatimonadota bacterium]
MKIRELLRELRKDGWHEVRRRGSHRVMRHSTKRGIVVVAGNRNADIKAGTLSQILKQAGLKEIDIGDEDGTD